MKTSSSFSRISWTPILFGMFLGAWCSLFFLDGDRQSFFIFAIFGGVGGYIVAGFRTSEEAKDPERSTYYNTIAGDRRPYQSANPYAPPQTPLPLRRGRAAPSEFPSEVQETPRRGEIPFGREIDWTEPPAVWGASEEERHLSQGSVGEGDPTLVEPEGTPLSVAWPSEDSGKPASSEGQANQASKTIHSAEDPSFASASLPSLHTLAPRLASEAHRLASEASHSTSDARRLASEAPHSTSDARRLASEAPHSTSKARPSALSPAAEARIAELLEAADTPSGSLPEPPTRSLSLALDVWAEKLSSLQASEREEAAQALAQRGPAVLFELLPYLADFLIREGFLRLLVLLGSDARLHLERLLTYGSDAQQEWLLGLYSEVHQESAKPALIRALQSSNPLLEQRARRELEAMGHSPDEVEALRHRTRTRAGG